MLYRNDVWQIRDGLPQNSIFCINQTSDGYLWLGTQEGLVRFNGIKFTVFDRDNTPELRSNYITTMTKDSQGTLWIGTKGGGLVSYKSGAFKHYGIHQGLGSENINTLLSCTSDCIFIGTDTGIDLMEKGFIKTINISTPLKAERVFVNAISQHTRKSIWVGTERHGLVLINLQNKTPSLQSHLFKGVNIKSLMVTSDNTLWIGTASGGLFSVNNGELSPPAYYSQLKGKEIISLFKDKKSALWIGTRGHGIFRLNQTRFFHYDSTHGLSCNLVKCFFEDREGSLWIGTFTGGLNRLIDTKIITYGTRHGLSHENTKGIFQDSKGRVWVGTEDGGVNCFHKGNFTHYSQKHGMGSNKVYSICEGPNNAIWMGTYGGGITVYRNGKFSTLTKDNGLSSNYVRTVYADSKGRIWVGTYGGGLNLIEGGKINPLSSLNGLVYARISAILEDKNGFIWVGTVGGGLCQLSNEGKLLRIFRKSNGFISDIILSLAEDLDGTVWIGTYDGLYHYRSGNFRFINKKDGLYDHLIYCILQDEGGNMWMSCNKGIFQIKKEVMQEFIEGKIKKLTCIPYGTTDGMRSTECNGVCQPAGFRTQQNDLWFPTIKGVAVISPKNMPVNQFVPPVNIEKVLLNNEDVTHQNHLVVSPGKYNLEIQYAALSYVAPEKIRFKYRMEGVDKSWIHAGSRRSVYYTNLSPGQMEFKVIASNNDGVWNYEGHSFKFTVKPYIYQTWWFYLLLALAFVGCTYGFIRLRMRQGRQKERELMSLVKFKTEELTETIAALGKANESKSELLNMVAHDLKNPLQVISGYIELISRKSNPNEHIAKEIEYIQKSSHQMSDLIENILNSSIIDSGAIELKIRPIDLSKLSHFVVDAFQGSAEKKNQKIYAAIEPDIFIQGEKSRIREILENLISNAIKYSPIGKSIWYFLKKKDQNVQMVVQDEGPGLNDRDMKKIFGKFQRLSAKPTGGEPSTGLGLSIVKSLVELHQGKIKVESKPGAGAKFLVELPLSDVKDEKHVSELPMNLGPSVKDFSEFEPFLEMEWRRSQRNRHPISLILISIDDLEHQNSLHLTRSNTKLMNQVGTLLCKSVNRPGDQVSHYKNNQFAIVLSETDAQGGATIAKKALQMVQKEFPKDITLSQGCATMFPRIKSDKKELISLAERALTESIELGGAQFTHLKGRKNWRQVLMPGKEDHPEPLG